MKKLIIITLLILIVFACSRKTIASSETNIPDREKKDRPNAEMVSQGKTVYNYRCGRSHSLKPVGKYTAAEWENILKVMTTKARLNETESTQVTTYVIANAKK